MSGRTAGLGSPSVEALTGSPVFVSLVRYNPVSVKPCVCIFGSRSDRLHTLVSLIVDPTPVLRCCHGLALCTLTTWLAADEAKEISTVTDYAQRAVSLLHYDHF